MDISDRPPLGAYAYEEIEQALHKMDNAYWSALSELRAVRPFTLGPIMQPSPEPPKQPEHLRGTLCAYAGELFRIEAEKYPDTPEISHWLTKLSERVTVRAMGAVESMNRSVLNILLDKETLGLSWHGLTPDQMRETIRECLDGIRESTLAQRRPTPESDPPTNESCPDSESLILPRHGSMTAQDSEQQFADGDLIARREKLLADYKVATGDPSNKMIYEAENCPIYKQQFYEWRRGELPDKSRTTRNFEIFLKAKRRPFKA